MPKKPKNAEGAGEKPAPRLVCSGCGSRDLVADAQDFLFVGRAHRQVNCRKCRYSWALPTEEVEKAELPVKDPEPEPKKPEKPQG